MSNLKEEAIFLAFITLFFFLLSEFASAAPQMAWDRRSEAPEWTRVTLDSVSFSSLPDRFPLDASRLCGKYAQLPRTKRVEFWAALISHIAKHESNFNTETILRECSKNSCIYGSCQYHTVYGYCMKGGHPQDGGLVISRGLGQISFGSALAYKCNAKRPLDLHIAAQNVQCMVKIADRLVTQNNQIMGKKNGSWAGVSRYWSVTRGTTEYTKKTLPQIEFAMRRLAICN